MENLIAEKRMPCPHQQTVTGESWCGDDSSEAYVKANASGSHDPEWLWVDGGGDIKCAVTDSQAQWWSPKRTVKRTSLWTSRKH